MSFLDLLCSAMGGVALLLFIFAALRKNAADQDAIFERRLLTIEIIEPSQGFDVGRDVFISLECKAGRDYGTIFDLDRTGDILTGGFRVSADFPSPKYQFVVESEAGTPMEMTIWLQRVDIADLMEESRARILQQGLRGKVYWTTSEDDYSEFSLTSLNLFTAQSIQLEIP